MYLSFKHPWGPRGSKSGREKTCDKSFQAWAEEPLGTDSHQTISKRSSKCWLLIGHKKCFVLLCPISEQHLLSSFCEFVHDGYWLEQSACLAHAPKTCMQSGNFQFDINCPFQNTVYLKTKHAFPTRYKLELTTGIHTFIDHAFVNIREFKMPRQLTATKKFHEIWTHIFSSLYCSYSPTRLLCKMQAHSSGAEFLTTILKFIKPGEKENFVIACLCPSLNVNFGIFTW